MPNRKFEGQTGSRKDFVILCSIAKFISNMIKEMALRKSVNSQMLAIWILGTDTTI